MNSDAPRGTHNSRRCCGGRQWRGLEAVERSCATEVVGPFSEMGMPEEHGIPDREDEALPGTPKCEVWDSASSVRRPTNGRAPRMGGKWLAFAIRAGRN